MGTVGLSFGSPTSGAGFDVSTTVSAIMANLSGVETPWNTQITSIDSQDTVLSSLGTLLSNLSTDISALTDAAGVMSEKTGSSSNTNVLDLTAASNAAIAGTHTVLVSALAATSSGYLTEVSSSSDTLSGSIVVQVGSRTAQTVTLTSADNTISGLASAINTAGLGVTASVLTDSTGSRLSLVSATSGANGNLTVTSAITDTTAAAPTVSYADTTPYTNTTADVGKLGAVDSSSDTLSGTVVVGLGGGTAQTFTMSSGNNTLSQLATTITSSGLGVTATVISNSDGTQSISMTATQADSSSPTVVGSASALSVSSSLTDTAPTLGYTSAVTGSNASLTVDGVSLVTSSNTVSNLIPGVTMQLLAASNTAVQVVIGNYNSGVESTVNSLVTDYNSLISAMATQEGNNASGVAEPLYGSPTLSMLQQDILSGINKVNPTGYLTSVSSTQTSTLTGSITIQVGTASAATIALTSADNTISGLAAAINSANIGVTASVVTSGGESSLTLASQLSGSSGALVVSSAIAASTPSLVTFADTGYTSDTGDTGTLGSGLSSTDTVTGSVVLEGGSGTLQTITLSSNNTLSGLAAAINSANIGITATIADTGTAGITLTSTTDGSTGALTVTSSLYDSSSPTTTTLAYTNSSDINSLTGLGISVNNDGTISLDATALDSVLNSDYSGVQALFQSANSWGVTFASTLNNAGTSSSTGILKLAENSNSSIESTLNADITRENLLISSETKSLTAELNSANEIMQELPSQLSGVNELYSAITGYNQSSG